MQCFHALLLLFGSLCFDAYAAERVDRYGMVEVVLQGADAGNPFIDLELSATFTRGAETFTPEGFYDGKGTYKIRFMPPSAGEWTWVTKSNPPDLMKKLGAEQGVTVVDLNALSVDYYKRTGVASITAMVMAIEAGETPGKTNDGSYANRHLANKIDGTHFRESLSKQYARMVASELARLGKGGDRVAAGVSAQLRSEVQAAIAADDWSAIHSEFARDIVGGDNAYYRDLVEKLLQLGALRKDAAGNFHPQDTMRTGEFVAALGAVMRLPAGALAQNADGPLSREVMGAILLDAYHARFSARPKYMADYNGKTVMPGAPGYDPNLDTGAQGAMYYPLVGWARLQDSAEVSAPYAAKLEEAYELGLLRSEAGIARGRLLSGRLLAPKTLVTRAKAAKALYFMWVLAQPPKAENNQRW